MNTRILFIMSAVIGVYWGCSPSPIHLSNNFGQSASLAVENQIADPDARMNLSAVKGLDGQAAGTAVQKYRESFKEEKEGPPPSLILSTVGSSGS